SSGTEEKRVSEQATQFAREGNGGLSQHREIAPAKKGQGAMPPAQGCRGSPGVACIDNPTRKSRAQVSPKHPFSAHIATDALTVNAP
ncbi:MAG: hypothetical protein ACI4OY_06830, partial [Aristaeellaceae bacterium]